MSYLENLALTYLGTVPPGKEDPKMLSDSLTVNTLGKGKQLDVYLPDSDERAMGYLAGPCPNRWGVFADGSTISQRLLELNGGQQEDRREHPVFGLVLLSVLQEVANRRLFSVVREERRLTYDASFQFNSPETLLGSWYAAFLSSLSYPVCLSVSLSCYNSHSNYLSFTSLSTLPSLTYLYLHLTYTYIIQVHGLRHFLSNSGIGCNSGL